MSVNRISSLFPHEKCYDNKTKKLHMLWIPTLRTIKILFKIFILSRSGSVFCPCLPLLIKVLKKKTVKFTVSPTYSMLLVQRMWIQVWERHGQTQFSGTTQQYASKDKDVATRAGTQILIFGHILLYTAWSSPR